MSARAKLSERALPMRKLAARFHENLQTYAADVDADIREARPRTER